MVSDLFPGFAYQIAGILPHAQVNHVNVGLQLAWHSTFVSTCFACASVILDVYGLQVFLEIKTNFNVTQYYFLGIKTILNFSVISF